MGAGTLLVIGLFILILFLLVIWLVRDERAKILGEIGERGGREVAVVDMAKRPRGVCKRCGASVEPNMTYCPRCGKPVNVIEKRKELGGGIAFVEQTVVRKDQR